MATLFILILLLGDSGVLQAPATGETQLNADNSKPMVLSACRNLGPNLRRVGWGKYGLQFDVSADDAQIFGGKMDVDYVRYVIKPKRGGDHLELWFGPMAFTSQPNKDLLLNSVDTQKRKIVNASGEEIGLDSSGKLKTGKIWRHTFMFVGGMDGAQYEAGQGNAEVFDRIINSACIVPPRRS